MRDEREKRKQRMKFCGLHNHTEYSNLKLRDCIVKIQDLVDRAISYGYNGIAITDHEILSGHIEAYNIGQKIKETHPDFKVILGNEIYLIDEHEYRNAPKYYHFILLAKDKIGYEQLRQLSSRAWRRAYMEKGMLRTPTFYQDINEVVKNDKGHLIASTACLGGLLDYAIVHKRTEEFNRFVQWGITTFGKDCFYLEMQDSDSDEQRIANTTIIRAAKHFGLNTIVTSDVHYLDAKDKDIHKAFLNSKEEDGRETEQFYKYTYLKKLDEIYRILSYLPKEEVTKAINNTQKVYEAIEDFSLLHSTIVPERQPAPFQLSHKLRPFYENYDAIRKFAESSYEQDRYLLYLIERGLDEKRIAPTPDIVDRINTELDVVWCISEKLNQRLSAYLNLVRNIVDIIWEVSFVGVSRGCFLPDSKVLMADGSCKNIQDVRIGDRVYTHKGRIQEVYDTPRYEVDETMYRVSVSDKEPFTCTDNHKILALPQKGKRYDRCSRKISFDTTPQWVEAQNLRIGDFVATPKEAALPSYTGQDCYEDDRYYYHRVLSVDTVPYRGVVYDLSVKYDTSYIINGCAVHNSAGSFYINYLIGITQMNPMPYNVPYWRFANKERADMMDIDIDVNPDKVPEIIDRLRAYYGEDNVLNCLTFKTESLKSAILTAARGLGVNNDDAQAIATLVPVERGKVASFKDCTVGDPERGVEPVVGFTAALQRHPRLYETVEKIEGIISGRGIHASALYIFNEGYIAHNSLMRAPNQTLITAFNMHDSDSMGALKFDLLSTALQTKLMKCMELLLADGVIHWQGSLRATYNKYLHPDVIRYDDPKLWESMATGRVLNLFQFETPVGGVCIRKARPQNVKQLASANAVMRLMAQEGQEAPMERYVRFRNNIQKWYDEMTQYGLTEHEQGILKNILADSFGVGPQQEEMMLLVQHPEIADFTLAEANKLRKAVSKKDSKTIEEMREKFFAKAGTGTCGRREFLDYIYEKNIAPQIGYAFSIPHTVAYSIEALQQANLALYYSPLYWQCACLSVNAGVMETALENYDIEVVSPSRYPKKELPPEEEVQITEEGYEKRPPQRTTDYGKLARALGEMHSIGVKILLPDINKARLDFSPDVHRNAILFGLKAITGINDETAKSIILHRPYTSLRQFTEKLGINRFQIINLIKAGAFDELEKRPRRQIMESYLYSDVAEQVPLLKTLTTAQLEKCVQGKFLPNEYADQAKMIFFQKWIKAHNLTSIDNRWYYVLEDEDTLKFFNAYFKHKLTQESDFTVVSGSVTVKRPALDKLIEESVTPLKTWFKSPTATNAYRDYIIAEKLTALTDRVCAGSLGRWEMESLSCYYTEHELAHFDRIKYDISDYNAMPEEPIAIGYRTDKTTGASIPVYRIQNIAGTVLKVDRMRRIVTILTTTGVVDVKFSYSAFALYSRQISVLCFRIKKVIDGAWLARGEKLIISGYRKDNMFTARRDYSDPSSRVVKRIVVTPTGGFEIIKDREKGDNQ